MEEGGRRVGKKMVRKEWGRAGSKKIGGGGEGGGGIGEEKGGVKKTNA